MRRIFIAGTDTGVGKTWVSLRIMATLAQRAGGVAGCKPLACGSEPGADGKQRHCDALALQAASSLPIPYSLVNPICLREPTAPHIAARKDACSITLGDMLGQITALENWLGRQTKNSPATLVCEGVGGWDVPINGEESMADFACQLEAEIILVVGLRLGCLNHARLSCRAIAGDLLRQGGEEARGRLRGFVVNCIEAHSAHSQDYIEALRDSLDVPMLAVVSHGGHEKIVLP